MRASTFATSPVQAAAKQLFLRTNVQSTECLTYLTLGFRPEIQDLNRDLLCFAAELRALEAHRYQLYAEMHSPSSAMRLIL